MTVFFFWLACTAEPLEEPVKEPEQQRSLVLYDDALLSYRDGDYKQAAAGFKLALKADPRSKELKNWFGLALFKAGRKDDALVIYNQALKEHPGSGDLRYNRAVVFVSLGHLESAAKDLIILYNNGHAHPDEVGRDSDFRMLQEDAQYGYLAPKPSIGIKIKQLNATGLLGEMFFVEWEFSHRNPLIFTHHEISPLISLARVVENTSTGVHKQFKTSLFLNWRAVSDGVGDTKAVAINSGDVFGEIDPVSIKVLKLNNKSYSDNGIDVLLPSQVNPLAKRNLVHRMENGWGLVTAPPNAQIEWNAINSVDLEYRYDRELRWVGKLTPDLSPLTGKILVGGEEVERFSLSAPNRK